MKTDFYARLGIYLVPIITLAALPLLTSCNESVNNPGASDPVWQEQRSDLVRDLSPELSPSDLATLVEGNHEFACELYRLLAPEQENLLISPLSIRMAFALAYAGARSETEAQMAEALRYRFATQEDLHRAFNALDLELSRRNDPGSEPDEEPIELYLANAFWGAEGDIFLPSYLDLLAVNYGCGIYTLPLNGDREGSRRVINAWVAEQTRQRIQDLLPPDAFSVGPLAAILTNTLYLKAQWEEPFALEATKTEEFNLRQGGTAQVPMMHHAGSFAYVAGTDFQALEIPYRRKELAMVFILPGAGLLAEFEERLDGSRLGQILSDLSSVDATVAVPRFRCETGVTLKSALGALGMQLPFEAAADFSGMDPLSGLWIHEAYHKTFISVDEKGTEAAAATAVVMTRESVPEVEFTLDRPFLYLIRDRVTGAILFLGRITNPVG